MQKRIVTGVLAGGVFLFACWYGQVPYQCLLAAMALIGMSEFIKMNKIPLSHPASILSFLGIVGLMAQLSIWFILFLFLLLPVVMQNRITIDQTTYLFSGVVYISFGFYAMWAVRDLNGFWISLLIFLAIWASDSGAYFTGKIFGKNLLWPTISPSKTVEGSIGGIVSSVLVLVLFSLFCPLSLSFFQLLGFGILISLFAQAGDFIESAYKRTKGVKDSGNILPGHGGILDRCDSWLIVFPMAQWLLAYWGVVLI